MFISRTVKAGLLALCLAGTVTTMGFAKDSAKDATEYITPFATSYAIPKDVEVTSLEGGVLSQYKDLGAFDEIGRSANDRHGDFIMLGDGQSRSREKKIAYYEITKKTPEATYAGLIVVMDRGSLTRLSNSPEFNEFFKKLNSKELTSFLAKLLTFYIESQKMTRADLLPSSFPAALTKHVGVPTVTKDNGDTVNYVQLDMPFVFDDGTVFAKMRQDYIFEKSGVNVILLVAKAADFDHLTPALAEMVEGSKPKEEPKDEAKDEAEAKNKDKNQDKNQDKNAEAKDAEAKSAESKSAEAKSLESKDAETKNVEAKKDEAKSADAKNADTKSADSKSAEAKD